MKKITTIEELVNNCENTTTMKEFIDSITDDGKEHDFADGTIKRFTVSEDAVPEEFVNLAHSNESGVKEAVDAMNERAKIASAEFIKKLNEYDEQVASREVMKRVDKIAHKIVNRTVITTRKFFTAAKNYAKKHPVECAFIMAVYYGAVIKGTITITEAMMKKIVEIVNKF